MLISENNFKNKPEFNVRELMQINEVFYQNKASCNDPKRQLLSPNCRWKIPEENTV